MGHFFSLDIQKKVSFYLKLKYYIIGICFETTIKCFSDFNIGSGNTKCSLK